MNQILGLDSTYIPGRKNQVANDTLDLKIQSNNGKFPSADLPIHAFLSLLLPTSKVKPNDLLLARNRLRETTRVPKYTGVLQCYSSHFADLSRKMLHDPVLSRIDQEHKVQAMEFFVLYLAQGSTMLCRSIKSGTIDYYLVAVIDLTIKHNQIDLEQDKHTIKYHFINNIQ